MSKFYVLEQYPGKVPTLAVKEAYHSRNDAREIAFMQAMIIIDECSIEQLADAVEWDWVIDDTDKDYLKVVQSIGGVKQLNHTVCYSVLEVD